MPHGGLAAPQGYLGLVPSPSPYQRLVWCLTVCRGTCSSHGCFPLLSDLQWSTHPPLLLAQLWHLKHANPIAGPAWWPGALALGFSHLPHCLDLVVWALACTYRTLVV